MPRLSFILWVALLGRLSAKDRLRSWGIAMDPNCVLCHGGVEDHKHLFFYCSFSRFGGLLRIGVVGGMLSGVWILRLNGV